MNIRIIRMIFVTLCIVLSVFLTTQLRNEVVLSDLLMALLLGGGSALVAVGLEYILSRHLSGLVPSILLGLVLQRH